MSGVFGNTRTPQPAPPPAPPEAGPTKIESQADQRDRRRRRGQKAGATILTSGEDELLSTTGASTILGASARA